MRERAARKEYLDNAATGASSTNKKGTRTTRVSGDALKSKIQSGEINP
jgi:hypothetical protein